MSIMPAITDEKLEPYGFTAETYVQLNDQTMTDEQMGDFKFIGLPKPPLVSDERWGKRERELTPRQKKVINLLAMGKRNIEVAEETGYTIDGITKILQIPGVRERVAHRQEMLYQHDVKGHIKLLMNKAYGVVESILEDHGEKSSIRLEAAKYVIDHVVGKAGQTITVKGNLLSDLMTKLDQARDVTLDVPDEPEYTQIQIDGSVADLAAEIAKNNLANVQSNIDNFVEQTDEFDQLVENLVEKDFVVGKRGAVGKS